VIRSHVNKCFNEHHVATVGVDFYLKNVDGESFNVKLMDIAGQEKFVGLAPTYYNCYGGTDAAIVVVDAREDEIDKSLEEATKWKKDIDEKVKGIGVFVPE